MKPILESEQERMEAVWRLRAIHISRRSLASRSDQNDFQVMIIEVEAERYGIELAEVAEVLPPIQVTPVPGAPSFFAGVVNVHGEIRPVADLKRLLGMEAAAVNDSLSRVILLRKQGREMGLIVDRVEQIRSVVSENPQASADRFSEPSTRYLKGLWHETLMLINTEALFAELLKETTS